MAENSPLQSYPDTFQPSISSIPDFESSDGVSRVFNQVSGDINQVSGCQLVKNHEKIEGFDCNDDFSREKLNLFSVNEVLKVELVKTDEKIEKMLSLDDKNDVGFVKNAEVSSSKPKILDTSSNNGNSDDDVRKKGEKRGNSGLNGARRNLKYSRKEMEKLRFVNVKSQKKFWRKIYNGFDDYVRKEYVELGCFKKNKQRAVPKKTYCQQGILGDSFSENVVHDAEIRNSTHVTFDGENGDEYGEDLVEWSEDDNSDDEYRSIQRPAFMVDGEPDFESGSPEDGFEYLRRVRWEAAHIPKVKVVKVDNSKLTEQSVYMPKIPDIEKCPPHLVPLKDWENEFIADFSDLRLALSDLRDTSDATSVDSDSIIFSRPECSKRTSKSQVPLELPEGGPTVSMLLAMDPVTKVGLLNRHISLFESASNLTKDDCAWFFALCAVVETPLDADTYASLRCLLRRCAKLRAEKDEFDDEVVMLNILVTIAGKVFGQSEN